MPTLIEDESVQLAVDGLYSAFAEYPLRHYTDPCRCCHSSADEAKLHVRPLKELGVEELLGYAFDAMLVWGKVEDLKHFFPRLLHLLVLPAPSLIDEIDFEIVFAKPRHAQWLTWPAAEQAAVRNFFRAVWKCALVSDEEQEPFLSIDEWLCSLGQSEDDLSPYLLEWAEDVRPESSTALARLIIQGAGQASYLGDAFWSGREVQSQQVRDWLHTSPVRTKLENAFRGASSPASREVFQVALDCLSG